MAMRSRAGRGIEPKLLRLLRRVGFAGFLRSKEAVDCELLVLLLGNSKVGEGGDSLPLTSLLVLLSIPPACLPPNLRCCSSISCSVVKGARVA